MEKTGLIAKVGLNINRGWRSHQLVENSKEMKEHNMVLSETLTLLKEVKTTKNINMALSIEEMLLRQELAVYANSPEQHNSTSAAIKQLQEARQSLAVVQDHKGYQAATATYSGKKKAAGLPLDSFREFLKSHSTRLTNRMSSSLSVPEKNILRQRKELLGMNKEVYVGMQREALGIAPGRGKGRER